MLTFRWVIGEKRSYIQVRAYDEVLPEDIAHIHLPEVDHEKPVILAVDAPSWVLACMVHRYSQAPAVAVYDENSGLAVVVVANDFPHHVGDAWYIDWPFGDSGSNFREEVLA